MPTTFFDANDTTQDICLLAYAAYCRGTDMCDKIKTEKIGWDVWRDGGIKPPQSGVFFRYLKTTFRRKERPSWCSPQRWPLNRSAANEREKSVLAALEVVERFVGVDYLEVFKRVPACGARFNVSRTTELTPLPRRPYLPQGRLLFRPSLRQTHPSRPHRRPLGA